MRLVIGALASPDSGSCDVDAQGRAWWTLVQGGTSQRMPCDMADNPACAACADAGAE